TGAGRRVRGLAGRKGPVDCSTEELQARRIEFVGPLPDALRPLELLVETKRQRLAREEDEVGLAVDPSEIVLRSVRGGDDADTGRAAEGERLGDVLRTATRCADQPDGRARRERRHLVHE